MAINKDEIIQLEKSFWERANDPDFFRERFADDGLAIMEPSGGYFDKDQAIEMSSKGKAFKNVRMDDIHVKELTPECVALAYHGEGIPEGTNEPYRGSICSIYVRRNGGWQLAVSDHHRREPEDKSNKK
jgi:hypothetical protein